MTERAAHLVDEVLPWVPVRQWVLTVPYRLRYQMAWNHGLSRAVLRAYSGHRDHSVRAIMITRSADRDRSSERSDARAIVSSLDPPRNRM
jgi:hypothetical protein